MSQDLERRNFMAGVAGLAGLRWGAEDYELEDLDWSDMQTGGPNVTGEFTPQSGGVWCRGTLGEFHIPAQKIDDRSMRVHYDSGGVLVDVEAEGDDVGGGTYAVMDSEDARELAAALYQASIELEHIRGQEYDPYAHEDDE